MASALLVAAGDNPERLKNEATFAKLCGVSPLDASSGKQERHRLNRGGDRQANSALWHIVFTRMVNDPRTKHYIERRMKDGRTKKEAIRCLKRYVAREVFAALPRSEFALDKPKEHRFGAVCRRAFDRVAEGDLLTLEGLGLRRPPTACESAG